VWLWRDLARGGMSSKPAIRQQRCRERQSKGERVVTVIVPDNEIGHLIRIGALANAEHLETKAIADALLRAAKMAADACGRTVTRDIERDRTALEST
jgi:hypothetical protein